MRAEVKTRAGTISEPVSDGVRPMALLISMLQEAVEKRPPVVLLGACITDAEGNVMQRLYSFTLARGGDAPMVTEVRLHVH